MIDAIIFSILFVLTTYCLIYIIWEDSPHNPNIIYCPWDNTLRLNLKHSYLQEVMMDGDWYRMSDEIENVDEFLEKEWGITRLSKERRIK